MPQHESEAMRQSSHIRSVMGAYARVGKTSKTYRSDAGDVNYAMFDKMMTGSNCKQGECDEARNGNGVVGGEERQPGVG